jgi:hypothetical protein
MGLVDAGGRAEGQPDAVHRQRIMTLQPLDSGRCGAVLHEVLGMDFEPADRGPAFDHLDHVGMAQTDARNAGEGVGGAGGHDVAFLWSTGSNSGFSGQALGSRLPPTTLAQEPAGR